MNNEDKYLKAIRILKGHRPVLTNKEKLTDDIMKRIGDSSEKSSLLEKSVNHLFRWVDIYWLRGAMAVAAAFFAGLFIIQQLVITNRLNNLEDQLVKTINTINGHDPDPGMMQRVFMNMIMTEEDSIKVSKSDLEALLNSYLEMQKKYEVDRLNIVPEKYMRYRIRKNPKESTNDDES